MRHVIDVGVWGCGGVWCPLAEQVVVYRKYRDGELPDIEFPNKDLLRPLQALCLRDGSIARQVRACTGRPSGL
jgi:hypothetical protein